MMRTLPKDNSSGFLDTLWSYAATDLYGVDVFTDILSGNASSLVYGTNPTLKGLGKIVTAIATYPMAAIDPFHTVEEYKKTVDEAYYDAVHTVTRLFGDTNAEPMSMEEAFHSIPVELRNHPDTIAILRLADQVSQLETEGHRKTMIASWLSEAENRGILERTPWYYALLSGLVLLPIDLSAWADLYLTSGLVRVGAITRQVVGGSAKHYGKIVLAGMGTGAVSGTAREALLWQGQEMRTVEMAIQAVAVETVLGGFLGAGMEYMGHTYTRAVARRAGTEATGGAMSPLLPVPTVEDLRSHMPPLSRSGMEDGFIESAYEQHGLSNLGGNTWMKDEYRVQLSKYKRDVLNDRLAAKGKERIPDSSIEQAWEWTTLTREEWTLWDAKVKNMTARHAADGVSFNRPILQEGDQPGLPGMTDASIDADEGVRLAEVEVFSALHAAEESIMLKKLEQIDGMATNYIANGLTMEGMKTAWEAAGGTFDPNDPAHEATRRLIENFRLERTAVVLNSGNVELGDLLSVRGRSREEIVANDKSSDDPLTPEKLTEYFRKELGADSPEYEILEPYLEHVREVGEKVSVRDVGILFSDANGGSPILVEATSKHNGRVVGWNPISTGGREIVVTIRHNPDHPLFATEEGALPGLSPLDRYKGESEITYRFSLQKKIGAGGKAVRVVILEDVVYKDTAARERFDSEQSARAVKSGDRLDPNRKRYVSPDAQRQLDKVSMRRALGRFLEDSGDDMLPTGADWGDVRLVSLKSSAVAQHASGEYDPHHMWAKDIAHRRLESGEGASVDLDEEGNWETSGSLSFSDIHSKYKEGSVKADARLVIEARVHNNESHEDFFGSTPDESVSIYLDKDGYVVGFVDGKGKARVEHLGKHHQEVITDIEGANPNGSTTSEINSMLGDHILPDPGEVEGVVRTLRGGRATPPVKLRPRIVKRFADHESPMTGRTTTRAVLDKKHLEEVMDTVNIDADFDAANPLKIKKKTGRVNVSQADNDSWEAFPRLQARMQLLLGINTGARDAEIRWLKWSDLKITRDSDDNIVSATLHVPAMAGKKTPAHIKRVYALEGHHVPFIKQLLRYKELEKTRIDYFAGKVGADGQSPEGGKYYHLAKEIKKRASENTDIGGEGTLMVRPYSLEGRGVLGGDLLDPGLNTNATAAQHRVVAWWKSHKNNMDKVLADSAGKPKSKRSDNWLRIAYPDGKSSHQNSALDVTRRTVLNLAYNSLDPDIVDGKYFETVVRIATGHAEPRAQIGGGKTVYEENYKQEYSSEADRVLRDDSDYKQVPAVVQQIHDNVGRLTEPEYYDPKHISGEAIGILSSTRAGPGHDTNALRAMAKDELDELREAYSSSGDKHEVAKYRESLDINIRLRMQSLRAKAAIKMTWGNIKMRKLQRANGERFWVVDMTYTPKPFKTPASGKIAPEKTLTTEDPELIRYLLEAETLAKNKPVFNDDTPVLSTLTSNPRLRKYQKYLNSKYFDGKFPDDLSPDSAYFRGMRDELPENVKWAVERPVSPGSSKTKFIFVDAKTATDADLSSFRGHVSEATLAHYTTPEALWAGLPIPPKAGKSGKKNYRTTTHIMREVRALHQSLWRILSSKGIQQPSIEDYLDLTLDVASLRKLLEDPVLNKRYNRGSWEFEGVPLVTDKAKPGYDPARIGAVLTEVRRDILSMHHIRTMDDLVYRTKTVYAKIKGVEVEPVGPKVHYAKITKRMKRLAIYSSQVADNQRRKYRAWHESVNMREGAIESSVKTSRPLRKARKVGDPETRHDTARTEDSMRSNAQNDRYLSPESESVQVERFNAETKTNVSTGINARKFHTQPAVIRTRLIGRKNDLFSERDGEVRALLRFDETIGNIIIAMKNPNAKDALEEVFHHVDVSLLKKTIPLELRGGVTDEMIDSLDRFAGDRTSVEGRERLVKAFIDFADNNRAADVEMYTVFEKLMRFIRRLFRIVETHPGRDMTGVMTPEVRAAFSQILQRNRLTSPSDIALRNAIANNVIDPNDPAQLANAALLVNSRARVLRQSLEDRSEAGILLPREEQELLDMVLAGAPQEMIELFGARVGTIAGKIVRSMMFLSPGSRLLGSENASAQYAGLMITNTGVIMDSGKRVGTSLDRQHNHLGIASHELAWEYKKIAERNVKEGGVLTVAEFDKLFPLAEQFLAPDEAIPKDFHIKTKELGVQGDTDFVASDRTDVFEAPELTDVDLRNVEEARQLHRDALIQEDIFLDTTGARLLLKVEDIRKFYSEAYNERLTSRIFDSGLVAENQRDVVDRIMRGWREFHEHMVGRGWDETKDPDVTTPEGMKLKRIHEDIAATDEQWGLAPNGTQTQKRAKKRLKARLDRLTNTDLPKQLAQMEALRPNEQKAMGIASQWGDPPLSITDQSWLGISTAPTSTHGTESRTILISDRWLLPYLKHSGSEQAVQFAKHNSIKGLSVGKLGRSDQKKYINDMNRLMRRAKEIEEEMLGTETQHRDPAATDTIEASIPALRRLERESEDILDEIELSTDIQMIVTDAYLMPSQLSDLTDLTPEGLVRFVDDITEMGRVRKGKIKKYRELSRKMQDDAADRLDDPAGPGLLTEAQIDDLDVRMGKLHSEIKKNAKEINEMSAQIGDRGGQLGEYHISERVRDHSGPDIEGSPPIVRNTSHGTSIGKQLRSRRMGDFEGFDYLGAGTVRIHGNIHSAVAKSAAIRKRGLNEVGNTVDVINSLEHLAAGVHRDAAARHGGLGRTKETWVKGLKEQAHLTASLRIIHDRLHGNHNKVSRHSPPWLRHALKNVRNLVYSMSMGAVVRSSVPDMASTAAVNGFGPSLVAFSKVARRHIGNIVARGADDPELQGFDRTMNAVEVTLGNYRQTAMNAIDPNRPLHDIGATGKSKGERITDVTSGLARATSTFSGITRWNGFWKEVNVLASMDHMLRMGRDLRDGKTPSDWDLRYIRRAGMTDADLISCSILADRFGRVEKTAFGGDFRWSAEYLWEPIDGISGAEIARLRNEFKGSMHTMADLAVISPDAGNVPGLSDSTDAGAMITQFKRFFMIATVNVTTPMAQRVFGGDPRVMAHMAAMSTLGAMVYWWSSAARGVDPGPALMNPERYSRQQWWNNVSQLVYEAIDRSGMMGIFSELLNLTERLGVGPSVAFGGKGLSRSQSRPIGQIVLGPAAGKMEEAGIAFHNGIKALFTDEPVSPAALRSWTRLTPLNNILPFTSVVNHGISIVGGRAAHRRFVNDFGSRDAGDQRDFYYSNFKWAEHRLADMVGLDVDYSNWHPGRKIGL